MGHAFWKGNIEERVKLLESNVLNCCLRITMSNLHKIGLKMREWHFRELSSSISQLGWSHVPSLYKPLPPPPPLPPRKVHLRHIFFALLAMNDTLPAKLKFRENTAIINSCFNILKSKHFLKQIKDNGDQIKQHFGVRCKARGLVWCFQSIPYSSHLILECWCYLLRLWSYFCYFSRTT